MSFQNSNLLWLLLVVPPVLAGFFWWGERVKRQLLTQFVEARLLSSLTVGISMARRKWRYALVIAAAAVLIATIARPLGGYDMEEVQQSGLDIVVAVDTSKSMLATDITPNRLERAKLAALELMQTAKADRLGLVAFAGDAFLECPLTIDDTAFQQSVQALDVNSIPQGGTAIAAAINTALSTFKEKTHHMALVLFTDGEDNDEGALEAAQNAAKEGLKIFTIGIGSAGGTMVQVPDGSGNTDFLRDEKGQVLKTKLNEQLLQQIATATGGFYLPLRGGSVIDTLYERGLAAMPKSEGAEKLIRHYHELFQWWLTAAILLLLAEFFLPERRRRGAPRPAAAGPLLVLMFSLLATASQASPTSAWQDYEKGNYTNALEEFTQLAAVRTNDLRLAFNAGDAAYRATNFDAAQKFFSQAALSPDLKLQQRAFYNLGNTEFQLAKQAKDLDALQDGFENAAKTYGRAVDLDKADGDAAYNLDFAKNAAEQIRRFKEAIRRAKGDADQAVRDRNYHQAVEIMDGLAKYQLAAKQFEDYTKKLKNIDAIAIPHQP